MAKPQKFQVVDLGTHFIKAIRAEFSEGQVTVTGGTAIPLACSSSELDSHLAEVTASFPVLAGFLDRKTPVHFIVNETLCPVGIAYLNNLPPEAVDEALASEQTKFISTFGVSTYETQAAGVSRSFRLREKVKDDGSLQIVAANAYAKSYYMDQESGLCSSNKVTFGGIYPRLFAYEDLYYLAFGAGGDAGNKVAVLVDIGFTSTEIVAFKDGNIVFHKILHMGGVDFLNELTDIDRSAHLDNAALVSIMSSSGFLDADVAVANLSLKVGDPNGYVETIQAQADQLFTKIQLAIDYFTTVAATDFNTSMNTVMAVRKGPEVVAFTGGIAACPGFLELAKHYFGSGCMVLNPEEFTTFKVVNAEIPSTGFGLAVGCVGLIGNKRNPEYNVGDTVGSFGGATGGSTFGVTPGAEPFVPNWAMFLMVSWILALAGFWWQNGQTIKSLQREQGTKMAQLEGSHDMIVNYRDAREEEQRATLQMEYGALLTANAMDWGTFLTDLSEALPDGVKLVLINTETTLPQSNPSDNASGWETTPKTLSITICGQSESRAGINEFLRNLKEAKQFSVKGSPSIQLAGQGVAGGGTVCQSPAGFSGDLQRHYSFRLKGEVAY